MTQVENVPAVPEEKFSSQHQRHMTRTETLVWPLWTPTHM